MSINRTHFPSEQDETYYFEISYLFSETIDRVWYCLRNISLISVVEPSLLSQVYLTKGKNFWIEGSEFKGYWVGVSGLKGTCVKVSNQLHEKYIRWEYDLDIQISFAKTIHLYSITNSDSTLCVLKVELLSVDEGDVQYRPIPSENDSYVQLYTDLLIKLDQYMKKTPVNLNNYESCIVNQRMEDLWDFITDLNKVTKVSKMLADTFEYKGDRFKIGTFIKGLNGAKAFFLRVKNVINEKNSNIWSYTLETFGTSNSVVKQDINITVIRINENSSQLSYTHTFHDIVPRSLISHFSKEKKKFLESIQSYCNKEQ